MEYDIEDESCLSPLGTGLSLGGTGLGLAAAKKAFERKPMWALGAAIGGVSWCAFDSATTKSGILNENVPWKTIGPYDSCEAPIITDLQSDGGIDVGDNCRDDRTGGAPQNPRPHENWFEALDKYPKEGDFPDAVSADHDTHGAR